MVVASLQGAASRTCPIYAPQPMLCPGQPMVWGLFGGGEDGV